MSRRWGKVQLRARLGSDPLAGMRARRDILVWPFLVLTLLGSSAWPRNGQSQERLGISVVSLGAAAQCRSRVYGAAVSQQALEDRDFRRLLLQQVGSLTPENGLKWEVVQPHRGHFDFRQGDALQQLARRHGLEMRGHTLVWERQEPAWLQTVASAELGPILKAHIETVVGHYRGQLRSWDVINEPLADDGSGLRRHRWWRALGPEYIDLALKWAHQSDPGARLLINEYGLEAQTPAAAVKRRETLALLRQLRRRNVPLHGLGLQAHLQAGLDHGGYEELVGFLKQVQALGLEIQITELDVDDRQLPGDLALRDQLVAAEYDNFLAAVLSNPAVRQVTTWGLSDRYTWLNSQAPRADGRGQRALPFDEALQAKPVVAVMGNRFARAASAAVSRRDRIATEQSTQKESEGIERADPVLLQQGILR
ncbi:MAG: endo-1,4-beta-xylanase [Cyanobacteriota bacterium]